MSEWGAGGLTNSDCARMVTEPEEWRRLVAAATGATFFHSWEWAQAVGSAFGWRIRPYVVSDSRMRIRLLLAFETPRGLEAAPVGYGGVLPIDCAQSTMSVLAAVEKAEGRRFVRVSGSAADSQTAVLGSLSGEKGHRTSVVHLKPSWEETLRAVLSESARDSIRIAKRSGVSVELVDSDSGLAAIYSIYLESMARVGASYRTPLELLSTLVEIGPESVNCLRAVVDGRTVAWGLFLRQGDHVFHWIAAYSHEARHAMPNHAILEHAICDSIAKGVDTFDLGASHTEGQRFAKSRWGAVSVDYEVWEAPGA